MDDHTRAFLDDDEMRLENVAVSCRWLERFSATQRSRTWPTFRQDGSQRGARRRRLGANAGRIALKTPTITACPAPRGVLASFTARARRDAAHAPAASRLAARPRRKAQPRIAGGLMKRPVPAGSPDAYVAALTGWRRACVEELRAAVRGAARLDEVIKWGHLVYIAAGPVLLIRAEEERVLLGFWRGQRLRALEPRLKAGGKYEMATVELREGDTLTRATVQRLTADAVALNEWFGDPTQVADRTSAHG
jgi:hypothetical protein